LHVVFAFCLTNCFRSDINFNKLYPAHIRKQARIHWTPLFITRLAVEFLVDKPGSRVLDIGSGTGKFCLTAACYAPEAHFYGVEYRPQLVQQAREVQNMLGITNVSFIQSDFTALNLQEFDHFYFYNSFFENLEETDHTVQHSEELYESYTNSLHQGLRNMPSGTRLVTYHSNHDEVPSSYRLVDSLENGDLNFWLKR
jgi:SAM-dependent methyltransferase